MANSYEDKTWILDTEAAVSTTYQLCIRRIQWHGMTDGNLLDITDGAANEIFAMAAVGTATAFYEKDFGDRGKYVIGLDVVDLDGGTVKIDLL